MLQEKATGGDGSVGNDDEDTKRVISALSCSTEKLASRGMPSTCLDSVDTSMYDDEDVVQQFVRPGAGDLPVLQDSDLEEVMDCDA